ncbi:MAG: hypothetical protein ABI239_11305 [Aquihabitans sp.]
MDSSDDQNKSEFHRIKGKVKKVLGAATADRQAEAEGAAEERLEAVPTEGEVQTEKQDVKEKYDETTEANPRPPAPPMVQEDL